MSRHRIEQYFDPQRTQLYFEKRPQTAQNFLGGILLGGAQTLE